MALTADQITAKNFKSFYDRIKPFLNGEAHAGFTPVGTVISYFGETTPQNYLICDGTQYNKADYPELWTHLSSLTDTTPYVIDGDNTKFKVPDLRGEFLRGTGTNSHTNGGTGTNVGIHQDPTMLPRIFAGSGAIYSQHSNSPSNVDAEIGKSTSYGVNNSSASTGTVVEKITTRPTNTAVLFCIAYKNIFYDISEGQANAMPIPSVTYKDRIIQYVGDTDSNFTNGYFYKCIEDTSTSPYTYLWTNVNVGASNSNNSSNIWGYLYNNAFYEDSAHTTLIPSDTDALYIDKSSKNLYEFDGTNYIELSEKDKSIVYQPGGSYAFANLPSNIADNLGKVYNVTDDFTTTADFIEGAGIEYQANTDVSVINAGTTQNPIYKYNIFLGSLAGYQKKFRYTTMPTASVDYLNVIIQYIGVTDTNYISGRFYKCIADNGNYSWTESQLKDNETETISLNDFNALSQAEKDNGKTYFVPDASPVANLTVMGNRFDKANIYTAEERMVGSWMGKPLYQKVFTVDHTAISNNTPCTIVDLSALSMDKLIRFVPLTRWAYEPYSQAGGGTIATSYWFDGGDNTIKIKTTAVAWFGSDFYMLVQYTKTTDTTISIGSPNDFSTDEMIVGTWIDGKPIYQKTIDCGVMPNNTTKEVIHNIENLDWIVSIAGTSINLTNGNRINLPFSSSTSNISVDVVVNDTKIQIACPSNKSAYSISYITLQYTKTTD